MNFIALYWMGGGGYHQYQQKNEFFSTDGKLLSTSWTFNKIQIVCHKFLWNFLSIFFFCSSIPKRNEVKRKIIRKSVAVKNEKHFWVKKEYNFSSEWHIKHGCEVAEDKGMHPTRKNILNFIVGISIGILVDKRRYGKVEGGGLF